MKKIVEYLKNTKNSKLEDLLDSLELQRDTIEDIRKEIAIKDIPLISLEGDMKKLREIMEYMEELKILSRELTEILENSIYSENEEETDDEKIRHSIKNYEQYRVDETVSHSLYGTFRHKRPCAFVLNNNKVEANSWKEILLKTCEILDTIDEKRFLKIIIDKKVQGRKKLLISESPKALRSPEKIGKSNVFIETNLSADAVKNLLKKILKEFEIPLTKYSIFLRADYTPMSNN